MTNNNEWNQPLPDEPAFEVVLPSKADLARTILKKIVRLELIEAALVDATMNFHSVEEDILKLKEQLKNTENGIILGYAGNEKELGANEKTRQAKLEELTKETREALHKAQLRKNSYTASLEQLKIRFSSLKRILEAYQNIGGLLGA